MALVNCPECGKRLSDDCVKCGCQLDSALIQYGLPNYKRRRRKVAFRLISLVMALLGLGLLSFGGFWAVKADFSYQTSLFWARKMILSDDYREKTDTFFEYSSTDVPTLVNYYGEYLSIFKDNKEFQSNYTDYCSLESFNEIWISGNYQDKDFKYIANRIKIMGMKNGYLSDFDSIRDVSYKCEELKESMDNTIMDYLCSDTDMVNERVYELRINKLKNNWPIFIFPLSGIGFIVGAIILFRKSFNKKYNP